MGLNIPREGFHYLCSGVLSPTEAFPHGQMVPGFQFVPIAPRPVSGPC